MVLGICMSSASPTGCYMHWECLFTKSPYYSFLKLQSRLPQKRSEVMFLGPGKLSFCNEKKLPFPVIESIRVDFSLCSVFSSWDRVY